MFGVRVLAVYADSPALIADALRGCLSGGDVLAPLHRRLSDAELAACLAEVDPELILVEPSTRARIAGLAGRIPLTETAPQGAAGWLAGADRPALLVYTSGTMGSPRGVLLGTDALCRSARATIELLSLGPDDRWLCPLPLYHIGGLQPLIRCELAGATPLLGGLERLEEATLVSVVPTQLKRLIEADRRPPPALRAMLVGGGPLSVELQREALSRGWPVLATYGLTETASMVCCVRPGDPTLGHCGPPLGGFNLSIDDGEIVVDDLRTGDLGWLDEAGNLHVLCRRTDLIVSGGENITPAEVEAALLRHPAVDQACVVGLDDPTWGQRVAAALVMSDRAATDGEILAVAEEVLARFKLPRQLLRLAELPRNSLGKLQRQRLRERFSARG